MKALKIIALSVFMIAAGITAFAQGGGKLQLAVTAGSSPVVNAYFQFLQKAYGEIGYELTMKKYPLKRTYASANSGASDGLLITSGAIVKSFKNLAVVPVPLTHIDLMVYTVDKEFKVAGPKSIRPYRIGILRGYPLSTKLTEGADRQILNNYKSLFSVLKIGRVDIALAMKRETTRFLKDNKGYESIKMLTPPLYSLPLYHILNKKHEELIPKITPIMKRLMAEGVLKRLYAPYIK